MLGKATFENVPRKVFNKLCDSLEDKNGIARGVYLRYEGSNRYGKVVIEEIPGNFSTYKNALAEFIASYFE